MKQKVLRVLEIEIILNVGVLIKFNFMSRCSVPIVSEFFGIKIFMYWDEHNPPHFHAEYGEFKAIISIRDSVVIKGVLPVKQLKLVLAWSEIHNEELLKNWNLAQKNGEISKVEPLK